MSQGSDAKGNCYHHRQCRPKQSALLIKEVDGESFEIESAISSALDYTFDCSSLSKSGVWYDIVIKDKTTVFSMK
jgi:hypothetical protein